MKLYYVELTQRMFVTADSEKDAISEAKYSASSEDYDEECAEEAYLYHLQSNPSWKGCYPYGRDPDNRTVEAYFESRSSEEAVP